VYYAAPHQVGAARKSSSDIFQPKTANVELQLKLTLDSLGLISPKKM
jgi:hypothetical protein